MKRLRPLGLRIALYAVLAGIAYVYLYPLLFMVATSFKSLTDLLDPMVQWLPRQPDVANFTRAWVVLNFPTTLTLTLLAALLPALAQTLVCALVGTGFARYPFPGSRLAFVLMLVVFILPPQVLLIPRFLVFKDLNLLGGLASTVVPALLAQGIGASLFILLFFQFARMIPKSLEESALVDGAGAAKVFLRITVPLMAPAFLIAFLFSMVWYWNETAQSGLFFGDGWTTLPLQIDRFTAAFEKHYPGGATGSVDKINEAVRMAGLLLATAPLLALYAVMQRWFVQSIDKAGITGE
ncbi:MAG: carbohydrate ABC transporter permease [Spirochaetales bacterium]